MAARVIGLNVFDSRTKGMAVEQHSEGEKYTGYTLQHGHKSLSVIGLNVSDSNTNSMAPEQHSEGESYTLYPEFFAWV